MTGPPATDQPRPSLAHSTAVMAAGTFLARITGFERLLALA